MEQDEIIKEVRHSGSLCRALDSISRPSTSMRSRGKEGMAEGRLA